MRFVIDNFNEKNTYRLDFTVENEEAKNPLQGQFANCSPYFKEPE